MDFRTKNQPTWPFPQKRVYANSIKPKPQPKAPYQDNFSDSILPTTWQQPSADSSFWQKMA